MKTLMILIMMLLTIGLKAQRFEDLNCLGLTSTEVKFKMMKLEIYTIDMGGGHSKIQTMNYRDLRFGLILVYLNDKFICYKQEFKVNYSHSELLSNDFIFTNCVKLVIEKRDYFVIEFYKSKN
jgi:hypothetical protein